MAAESAGRPWKLDLDRVFRDESPRVLGALMRRFGNLDIAQDAFQDACLRAAETWPGEGTPRNAGAWLTTVASNAALDRVRREAVRVPKETAATVLAGSQASGGADLEYELALLDDTPLGDDQLRLIFMCVHPALSLEAQVALTLRVVGGLATPEIARAFLVPEATMAQRIVRAKRKIALAGIPFRMPDGEESRSRIDAVLHVVYLIFNEGYSGTSELVRPDLCVEALRLAGLLLQLLPHDPEVLGLHSLLLLHDARRAARVDSAGRIVPLEDQDRALWSASAIRLGLEQVERALRSGPVGRYQLQAAIAAVHVEADSAETTDWAQIVELYRLLDRVAPGPLVRLNLAVALAERDGAAAGLEVLDELAASGALARHHRLDAARAQLLERLGRLGDAEVAYRRSLELVDNAAERGYLEMRLSKLT